MLLLILLALLVALLIGLGFVVKWLFIIAIIAALVWVIARRPSSCGCPFERGKPPGLVEGVSSAASVF
jgi:hypothetical protein